MRFNRIFIIGTGRSGTHLLAEIIDSHPDIPVVYEDKNFYISQDIAIKGIDRWDEYHPTGCEKSHQNLWIAEELHRRFPDSGFIYTKRNTEDIVKSMIAHGGILGWFDMEGVNPKFLGYDVKPTDATIEDLCRLRIDAHNKEYERLKDIIPIHLFNFDNLMANKDEEISKLEKFLDVNGLTTPKLKYAK